MATHRLRIWRGAQYSWHIWILLLIICVNFFFAIILANFIRDYLFMF